MRGRVGGRGLDMNQSGGIPPKGQYCSAQSPHELCRARYSKERSPLEWWDPKGTGPPPILHPQDICLALGWREPLCVGC